MKLDLQINCFFVLYIFFGIFALLGWTTTLNAQNAANPSSFIQTFEIRGVVIGAPDITSYLDRLEAAMQESSEEGSKVLRQLGHIESPPASGAMVILRSSHLTQKTTTDKNGQFQFLKVPLDDYEIWAEVPSCPAIIKGQTRTAIAVQHILKHDPSDANIVYNVILTLRTDLITITGRVADAQGKPIAGARVVAMRDIDNVSSQGAKGYFEAGNPPLKWADTSNTEGYYEIRGVEPTGGSSGMGYVRIVGSKYVPDSVDVHVDAEGYVQTKEQIPRVPCVTEDDVTLGRRFLKILNIMNRRAGKPEFKEETGATYPTSHGNTITGIDITLQKHSE